MVFFMCMGVAVLCYITHAVFGKLHACRACVASLAAAQLQRDFTRILATA